MRSLTLTLLAAALVSCTGPTDDVPAGGQRQVVEFTRSGEGTVTLQVDIADDEEERAQGLMGVASLPDRSGMAFVFDAPTTGSFWMKDTLIPLSIAFVDAGGTIVAIREMAPCEADPCPTYGVDRPYTMAVEANRGYFGSEDIRAGDTATLMEVNDD